MAEDAASDERELVSREQGRQLAEDWRVKPGSLKIPNTLLSSQDIVKVVQATGIISPFYTEGGKKGRLKKASYEGRIGTRPSYTVIKIFHVRSFAPTVMSD